VCDIENDFALYPLTEETGAIAPSVTPDGKRVYYFVNQTRVGGGHLVLKRVDMEGRNRQVVMVVDTSLPGTAFRPSLIYPLSTISSDGVLGLGRVWNSSGVCHTGTGQPLRTRRGQ